MDHNSGYLLLFIVILFLLRLISGETYSVKISIEEYVNIIDARFLSLTVDPKYLFSSSRKYIGLGPSCMARALSPALFRLAGPSTSSIIFTNSSNIALSDTEGYDQDHSLTLTHRQWNDFLVWAAEANFTLVFALSIEQKTPSGLWDPNAALRILTVAEKANVTDVYWQLGYECTNQTLVEYLGDLETLRVIVDTFPEEARWRVVPGDVTKCLRRGEFSDYVTFTEDNADAVPLNGNASAQELERMSNTERVKLIKLLSTSGKPLWLTESPRFTDDNNRHRRSPSDFDYHSYEDIVYDDSHEHAEESRHDYVYAHDYYDDSHINGFRSLRNVEYGDHDPESKENQSLDLSQESIKDNISKHERKPQQENYSQETNQPLRHVKTLDGYTNRRDNKKDIESSDEISSRPLNDELNNEVKHRNQKSQLNELYRAADWMTSLGYSARNGFSVHFRELVEEELYEPTLSFYMALLFKNLVGDRVLTADIEASQAAFFAHCTSLRHKPVPGAVTFYGANLDDNDAKFGVKLSRRENGGEIMQFVLRRDDDGNILVNERAMHQEGDIRPDVKEVRPYKTLLLNLPPKSFGFWVVANTKVEACYDKDDRNKNSALDNENKVNTFKVKRSLNSRRKFDNFEFNDVLSDHGAEMKKENKGLYERINKLNHEINSVRTSLYNTIKKRVKRDLDDRSDGGKMKLRKFNFRQKLDRTRDFNDNSKPRFEFIRKLFDLSPRPTNTRRIKAEKPLKGSKMSKNKVSKRHLRQSKSKPKSTYSLEEVNICDSDNNLKRKRRSLKREHNDHEPLSSENEIKVESLKDMKLWKILHKIHEQLDNLPSTEEIVDNHQDLPSTEEILDNHQEKEDLNNDVEVIKRIEGVHHKIRRKGEEYLAANMNTSEKSKHGLLKSTIGSVLSVLGDLNSNLNKFWGVFSVLD